MNYKSQVIVSYGPVFGITFHLDQLISAEVQCGSLSHVWADIKMENLSVISSAGNELVTLLHFE